MSESSSNTPNKKEFIFVDDLRIAPKRYTKVFRTGESFISWLAHHQDVEIELLSLDHDLGPETGPDALMNGHDIVKEMIELELTSNIKAVQCHTDNNQGFRNMVLTLHSAVKHGAIPPLKINTTKYDCIDGQENPSPWFRIKLN